MKLILKKMREELPDGRRFLEHGTTGLPYSQSTPALVRRLIGIKVNRAVLRRDHFICQDCGEDFGRTRRRVNDATVRRARGGYVWESLEVHHIIPRSRQGSDHPGNLKTLCPACHRKYTTELMVDIVEERGKERELIRRMRELPDEREVWDFRGE